MSKKVEDALREQLRSVSEGYVKRIEAITSANNQYATNEQRFRAEFDKFMARALENDTVIQNLKNEVTLLRSDYEASGARFVEVENERDVLKFQLKDLESEKRLSASLSKQLLRSVDDIRTLMAALKGLTQK